jgi:hypothetical protein
MQTGRIRIVLNLQKKILIVFFAMPLTVLTYPLHVRVNLFDHIGKDLEVFHPRKK